MGKQSDHQGDFVNDNPDGFGVGVDADGTTVEGKFKDGMPFGPSIREWANGAILEGFQESIHTYEGPARYISGCQQYEIHIYFESGLARKATLIRSPDLVNGEVLDIPLSKDENESQAEIYLQLESAGFDTNYIKGKLRHL